MVRAKEPFMHSWGVGGKGSPCMPEMSGCHMRGVCTGCAVVAAGLHMHGLCNKGLGCNKHCNSLCRATR